jgi:hypothetical protein
VICDWDDHHPKNDAMPWMLRLKELNPGFRATLFAVPALGSDEFWDSHPDWIELAMHGEYHPNPMEAADWSYDKAMPVLRAKPARFATLWKSPGWQISDGTYVALLELGWTVADQPYNDARRPKELRVHRLGDGDHLHGHVQNVCENGLEETWDDVSSRVAAATEFEWVSEAAR